MLTNCGIPRKRVEFFDPMIFTIKQNNRFPAIAPIGNIDPVQDNSSIVNGPDSIGVSLDCNNGNAVVSQTKPGPVHSISKFAGKTKNKSRLLVERKF